ncbi:molybdate ABC transporter permease subunit [Fischerella thermalis CCMEE 5198]|jgi:molybdate transport system permease protein|uniref:molybdate ABC transporter permease subunit n=1 Tax=Fischerella thermalis TaxID=372787 RepID=UPI000C7FB342|nr:molybdate ABC transporter permease subunit [Fischerella thermalis]PLZ90229.1 molybdate ABC transporter permease subunit [Fischerella thermalis CCMEE 5196]PMB22561.1 molybdate ABC transporter permease subunit [Fischerella thermalis CCMEE 5198]
MDWFPYILSLQVTALATVLLLVFGMGLAIFLARVRFPGELIISTVLNLPLVLPPSVIGFYLLLALGRGSPILEWFGIDILFTWQAAAIASAIVALPLIVEAARAAILDVNPELEAAARTLGDSEIKVLWRVTLPLARSGILAGFILAVARALGEFGATLMVAGNIPERTQTLPLAIYDAVQNQEYGKANLMVLVMTFWTFLLLLWARSLEQRRQKRFTEKIIKTKDAAFSRHSQTTSQLSSRSEI